jgi:hypothetical protein
MPPPEPALDGITHINVHYKFSNPNYKLGRMLSTYYVARFHHPYFGPFDCIEGFLLYVRTGCRDDAFRHLNGTEAKRYYREQCRLGILSKQNIPREDEVFMNALYAQLQQHPVIAKLFVKSVLPFDAYYFTGQGMVPIRQGNAEMLIKSLTSLRDLMKNQQAPQPLSAEFYKSLRKT